MEQILAFFLGVGIALLVWGVVVMFKTAKLAKQNEESISNIEVWLEKTNDSANERINQEVVRLEKLHDDSIRYVDSRIDKLEAKRLSELGAKQVLKG